MSKSVNESGESFTSGRYPPEFLAKYKIVSRLSSCPRGETFLVEDRAKGEYRCAKVFAGSVYRADVDALGELRHPGLVKLVERITSPEADVLVWSFANGKSLDEAMSERAFSRGEIISIGTQLCDVLAYMHSRNPPVIHRDVKPQNVILDEDGTVTLIDLGIAKTYISQAVTERVFYGTREFAPPEQYGFSQTDARADIYSLGVLLKYLLTRGKLSEEVKDRPLRRVVKRSTAFAPRERYSSAQSVKRALSRCSDEFRHYTALAVIAAAAFFCGIILGRLTPGII